MAVRNNAFFCGNQKVSSIQTSLIAGFAVPSKSSLPMQDGYPDCERTSQALTSRITLRSSLIRSSFGSDTVNSPFFIA
jgi:hypothetical protein